MTEKEHTTKNMNFDELLTLVTQKKAPALCADSRQIQASDIFLAIRGAESDGHDFIGQAIEKGAGYIVTEAPCHCREAEVIVVEDSTKAAAILAQASYGYPAAKLTNLAVTGTNGKTTVAFLVRSIIQKAGKKCGLISTILYDTINSARCAPLTTPNALKIAELQGQMVAADAKYMVTEASSHALNQGRLWGIDFKAAAFTNLTGDHLDYHKTEDNYLAAKSSLFEKMSSSQTAVLNKQSPQAAVIAEKTEAAVLWYAIDQQADLAAHIETMDITGSIFTLDYNGQNQRVKTSLSGRYNVSNCLAAAGLCIAAGFDLETIAAGISALKAVPGRLEKVEWDGDFSVLIDYAHTDDALKNVLLALKPLCRGRLIVLFGCGGDRDKTKRPRMARVAEQLADIVIVTTDNPRTESAAAILGEIAVGFENPAAETMIIEIDRERAIEMAVETAKAGDIILIAGKGHEDYQIIGNEKIDFNDCQVAKKYMAKRK